jgi:transcriptional regulator with XRE-family HTH domain
MAEKFAGNNEKPKPAESGSVGKDKAAESGDKVGVSNDKAVGVSGGDKVSVSNDKANVSDDKFSVSDYKAGASDDKASVSNEKTGVVSGDKVGEILKKERLTRRITVEAIAKDLKLNVGYVKALEAGDHASLPPEPYIRVYIKSLTKYLSLDTEAILREFDKERGLIAEDYDKSVNKIDISVQKPEKNMTLIVAAALIAALAVFAFIANQKGWLTQPESAAVIEEPVDSTGLANADSMDNDTDDNMIAAMAVPETSAAAITKAAKTPPKP